MIFKRLVGGYDPGMKDARFQASVTAAGRALRWNPQTYGQAWLFVAFSAAVTALVMIWIFGASSGWRFTAFLVTPVFVILGLGASYRFTSSTPTRERCQRQADSGSTIAYLGSVPLPFQDGGANRGSHGYTYWGASAARSLSWPMRSISSRRLAQALGMEQC